MTDEEKNKTFSSIIIVEDVRFIQLLLKNIIINNRYTYYSYLQLPNSYINCGEKSDFYDLNFKSASPFVLIALCKIVIDKLTLSPLNLLDGISIGTQ